MRYEESSDVVNNERLSSLEEQLDVSLRAYASVWPDINHPTKHQLNRSTNTFIEAVRAAAEAQPLPEISDDLWESTDSFRERPVFIVGCKKSGTTLLRNLMDGHPRLVVLPSEGKYWTDFIPRVEHLDQASQRIALGQTWIRRLTNSVAQPPFWLLGRTSTEGENPYVQFLRYFLAWAEHVQGHGRGDLLLALILALHTVTRNERGRREAPLYWVEKTPFLEHHVTDILTAFPQAQFIHVVRDPRAVIASLKKMREGKTGTSYPIARDTLVLRNSLSAGERNMKSLGKERYRIVRFEELVEQPADVMSRLAGSLDLPFDASLLVPMVQGIPATSNSAYKELRSKGEIYSSSVARHERTLTAADHVFVEGTLHRIASRFGYMLPAPRWSTFLRACIRLAPMTVDQSARALMRQMRR